MIFQLYAGIIFSFLVMLVGISWMYWVVKKRKFIKFKEKYFKENGGLLLQQQLATQVMEATKVYTTKELEQATNNYHKSQSSW